MKIPHLRLILKTLLFLPISVKSLQESSVGRHVNKLKSHSDSEVSKLATQCVKEWSNLLSNVVERKVQSEDLKQKKKRPLEEPEVQNTNKNPPLKRAKNIASSVTQTTIKATPTSPSLSQSLNQTTKPNILSNAPNSASTNPTTKPPAPV